MSMNNPLTTRADEILEEVRDATLHALNVTTVGQHTVKPALANVAASQTDSSLVAAVAGKKIRVLSAVAVAGGTATNLTFNSKGGGAGVAISCLFANGANGGFVLPMSADGSGWFETNTGEALTVTTGAGSTTGILVKYAEV